MATQPQTLYTYADLERFPEDNLRREIIDSDHDVVKRTCCSFGPSTSNAWNGSSSGPPPMS